MNKLIFFFISSLSILIISVIAVNISPCINKFLDITWPYVDCNYYSDSYEIVKKQDFSQITNGEKQKETELNKLKKEKTRCQIRQAIYALEYLTFNFNIFFELMCSLLVFLLCLNIKDVGKFIGHIGIISGILGFIVTVAYVFVSILVFTDISSIIRIDSDGAALEWNQSLHRYTCIFYKEDNEDEFYFKYSDLNNKYLNYRKDIYFAKEENKLQYQSYDSRKGCTYPTYSSSSYPSGLSLDVCKKLNDKSLANSVTFFNSYSELTTLQGYYSNSERKGDCRKLFVFPIDTNKKYKIFYDRFLATIIAGCLICIFKIFLVVSGFLLCKQPKHSSIPMTTDY